MRRLCWTSASIIVLTATPVAVVLLWLTQTPLAPLTAILLAGAAGTLLATHQAMAISDHQRALDRLRQAVEAGSPRAAGALPADLAVLRDEVDRQMARLAQEADTTRALFEAQRFEGELLRADQAQLVAALGQVSEAVVAFDGSGRIAQASPAAAQLLGLPTGRTEARMLSDCPGGSELMAMAQRLEEESVLGAAPLRRSMKLDRHGELEAVVSTVDWPDEKKASFVARLSAARNPAEDGDLIACVSHELRTPLSSIRAYIELLMDGEAGDELSRAQFYSIIEGETNRLMRLIDNILGITRVERGLITVQRDPLDLTHLVHESVELLQPQARAQHVNMAMASSESVTVLADHDLMMQVMANLLSNAIKYSPRGGTVTVRVQREGNEALVSVADTGVGIPEAELPHVFDRFYRVAEHRRLAGGTGLGLSLVRHAVESVHAGRVWVNSKVGEGSTFTFALAIAEDSYGPRG